MFAKLFDTEIGQILVKIDSNDRGPEVRFYTQPEGAGVCSTAITFSDDEAGLAAAQKAFDNADAAIALSITREIVEFADQLCSDETVEVGHGD